jgi:hypothetical protein
MWRDQKFEKRDLFINGIFLNICIYLKVSIKKKFNGKRKIKVYSLWPKSKMKYFKK